MSRKLPLELSLILLPAVAAFFCLIYILFREPVMVVALKKLSSSISYFAFAVPFAIPLFLYMPFKDAKTPAFNKIFLSFIYLSASVALLFAVNIILTVLIFISVTPDRVASASQMLWNLDMTIFHVAPGFFLHTLSLPLWLVRVIVWSYSHAIDMVFYFFFILIWHKRLLREFVMSFFIVTLIAMPLWLAFPAIAPLQYVIKNELSVTQSQDIFYIIDSQKSPAFVTDTLEKLNTYWVSKDYFAVSNFPSMHVAWVFLVLLYAARISKKWLFIGVPYLVLVMTGTIYLYQHFAVDSLFGFILAGCVFLFVKYIYEKDSTGESSLLVLLTFAEQIRKKIF